MAIERNNYRLDVVTSSPARTDAFRTLLGPQRVRQVLPHFTEDVIRKPDAQKPHEWPMEMAERKALQDVAALMVLSYVNQTVETGHIEDVHVKGRRVIRLYSDTVNIAFADDMSDEQTMILEKPKSVAQWLTDTKNGAMVMSGKNFEICTALTAIDMTDTTLHPTTILIRISGKMKPFTTGDVRQFIQKYGEENILKSASGISFINEKQIFLTPANLYGYTHKWILKFRQIFCLNSPTGLLFPKKIACEFSTAQYRKRSTW